MEAVKKFRSYTPEYLAAIPGLLTVLTGALHYGWTSPAIHKYQSGNETLKLTFDESSRLITTFGIGNVIGPFGMLLTADVFGRKIAVLAANIPILIGWIMVAFAQNVETLYAARLLAGAGLNLGLAIAPIYFGEIASDAIRGGLCTMPQVMIALGPIIEYLMVPYFNIASSATISAVLALIVIPMLYWMPESPYYLLMKNKEAEARKILKILRHGKDSDEEFDKIKMTLKYQMENKTGFKDLIYKKNCRNGILMVCGVLTVFVLSGVHMVIAYAHLMVEYVDESAPRNMIALIMVIVPSIAGLISTGTVDRLGKRPLYFVSTLGCFIMTLIIGVYCHMKFLNYNTSTWTVIPLLCLIAFQFFNGLALSSFGFVYLGELLSVNIKVYAATIAQCYVCLIITIQNEIYQSLFTSYSFYAPFYMFTIGSFIGLFYLIILPETKGKSLHEIQIILGAKYDKVAEGMQSSNMELHPSSDYI